MKRFHFVRHGQSEANISGRWQGHGDAPLSALGREQAKALAARLRKERFDHIISSDLQRARDTALALGRPITEDPRFREIDVGRWEGLTQAEVAKLFPEEVEALRRGAADVKVGGGESWGEVFERIDAAFHDVADNSDGARDIGIFAHGGILNSLFTGFFDVRKRHPRPLGHLVNTSVSVIRKRGDLIHLERYNDGTHHPSIAELDRPRFPESAMLAALALEPGEDPLRNLLPLRGAQQLFAPDHLRAEARALGAALSVPVEIVSDSIPTLLERARSTLRGAVLASREAVRDAAEEMVLPGERSKVEFLLPAARSVTHLIRMPRATILGAYSIGGE